MMMQDKIMVNGKTVRACRNCFRKCDLLVQTCEIFARRKDDEIQNDEKGEMKEKEKDGVPRFCFRAMCIECVKHFLSSKEMHTWDIASAPVKAQYILPVKTNCDDGEGRKKRGEGDCVPEEVEVKLKRQKVDNSTDKSNVDICCSVQNNISKDIQNERSLKKVLNKTQFCTRFIRYGTCEYGEGNCRFSHDIQAYIDAKPPDLVGFLIEKCPWTIDGTSCPYGISCRFSLSHTEVQTSQDSSHIINISENKFIIDSKNKNINNDPSSMKEEINFLSQSLQNKLRKNEINFPLSKMALNENNVKDKFNKTKANALNIKDFIKQKEQNCAPDNCPDDYMKIIDFRDKLYLAPLTTVGNLPFRRVCKILGADITCGEMAMANKLLQGHQSEWALLRRHPSEDLFGAQICGGFPDTLSRCAELIDATCRVDFIDINMGCPIDLVCDKGAGSSLLLKPRRIQDIVKCTSKVINCPLTFKTRTGYYDNKAQRTSHDLICSAAAWGASAVTLHGRTRQQRYTRQADWDYIYQTANAARKMCKKEFCFIGNGDVYTYEDYNRHKNYFNENETDSNYSMINPVGTIMIARGALIKPWIFSEIKEQRHIDISSQERLEYLKKFVSYGLEHWGSDVRGVETTRRFLLEWLSFLHRYIPVGLLEVQSPHLHWRPPSMSSSVLVCRNELETLFASKKPQDWIAISEMLLGPTPTSYGYKQFIPKHKSNAYEGESG